MGKIILEKTKNFEHISEGYKPRLENIFKKEFNNLEELKAELHGDKIPVGKRLPSYFYIPKEQRVEIDNLPYVINEWPLCGQTKNGFPNVIIAKIMAVK